MPRKLRVEFSSHEAFVREYELNLAKGGIFVSSMDTFDLHESVSVELDLSYSDRRVVLEGEVVHCILPALTGTGAKPGVAIQLRNRASELRGIFGDLIGEAASENEEVAGTGMRRAPRADAAEPVTLSCEDGSTINGRTRNISDTGMLVAVKGQTVAIGTRVDASLIHPKTQVQTRVGGAVVRHVKAQDGSVMALGIKFDAPPGEDPDLTDWVGEVRATEHSKQLGGISGSIAELGMASMLHMFATYSPQGSLVLTRAGQRGELLFEGGLVRGAQLEDLRDGAALAELIEWTEGDFEFLAQADTKQFGDIALPIDDAIHEATQRREDRLNSLRPELSSYSMEAKLSVLGSVDMESLGKTEQAIIDLARVEMTLAKAVEIIPERDEQILSSLQDLMDHGLVALND